MPTTRAMARAQADGSDPNPTPSAPKPTKPKTTKPKATSKKSVDDKEPELEAPIAAASSSTDAPASTDEDPNPTTLTDAETDLLVKTATKDAAHRRMEPLDIAKEAGLGRFSLQAIEAAFASRGMGRYPETKVTAKERKQIEKGTHFGQSEVGKKWLNENGEVRDVKGNVVKKGKK